MKTFLFKSMIGIFFGAFIAVVITNILIFFGDNMVLDGQLFMKNSLASVFLGWLSTVSPLYFEIRNLKLWQQTVLHFSTVSIVYFILVFAVKWIPFSLKYFSILLVVFLGFYLVIWFAFYLYYKSQANKLNIEIDQL